MLKLIELLNLCFWWDYWEEWRVEIMKTELIDKAKTFLQWLIDNNHIEMVWEGDINDYIRYIATTEDPIQTLIDLLK